MGRSTARAFKLKGEQKRRQVKEDGVRRRQTEGWLSAGGRARGPRPTPEARRHEEEGLLELTPTCRGHFRLTARTVR